MATGVQCSAGDLICVGINWGSQGQTYTVTDNATGGSNSYTQFPSVQIGTAQNDLNAFWAIASHSDTLTVTVSMSGGVSHSLRVGVYIFHSTTNWAASPVDVGNSNLDGVVTDTTANPGNITPAASGELLISFIQFGAAAVSAISVTGWTEDPGGTGPGWGAAGRSDGAYNLNSGNTSTTASWNWTTGSNSSSIICAFTPGPPPPPGGPVFVPLPSSPPHVVRLSTRLTY